VNIINAAGQKIYSTQLKQVSGLYRKLLNLKESPNGIYYLQIISDDAMISKKIIKQE
jgi:hypothetical protein